jgi:hypothetical protein
MYEAQISRTEPSAFLFLIDQSGSMAGDWGGEAGKKKADAVATILNRLLQNLVLRCAKEEGIRDYYDVGVLGYGARVSPALGGALTGNDLVPISQLGNNPIRVDERAKKVDDGAGGLIEQRIKLPVWVDPAADNGTPMTQAFARAVAILEPWVRQHPTSFPPIVMNITDGEPSDGDPSSKAAELVALSTSDGSVLLFNIHISSQSGAPIVFPASEGVLPDDHARLLFRMSSVLPPYMRSAAQQEDLDAETESRGFAFQSDAASVIQLLDIGTRPSNMIDPGQLE